MHNFLLSENISEDKIEVFYYESFRTFTFVKIIVAKNIKMSLLESGDVLLIPNSGAYTVASASNFNGFKKIKIVCV